MALPERPSNPHHPDDRLRRLARSNRSTDWLPQPSWKRTALAAGAATLFLAACPLPLSHDPSFAAAVKNPFGITGVAAPAAPAFADIDGDGSYDLFAGGGGEFSGVIAYFANKGCRSRPKFAAAADYPGLPAVGAEINGAPIPAFAPLFGTSEFDMVVGHSHIAGTGAPWWEAYENDGGPYLSATVPDDLYALSGGYALSAAMVDIDGDSLADAIVSATDSSDVNTISFYKNTGTASTPVFTDQSDDLGLVMPSSSYAYPTFVDIDADGDFDAFAGDENGDLWYFENTGTSTAPAFAAAVLEPFGLDAVPAGSTVPTFVDIDHDGDFDLFVGDANGDFWFFENTDF